MEKEEELKCHKCGLPIKLNKIPDAITTVCQYCGHEMPND